MKSLTQPAMALAIGALMPSYILGCSEAPTPYASTSTTTVTGGTMGSTVTGSGGATTTTTGTGTTGTTTTGVVAPSDCNTPHPGRAPLRRLTRFEYNNSVQALLGDMNLPANSLPAELLGNGFGNDADQQPVSSFLVEQYSIIAGEVATRAVQDPNKLAQFAPCLSSVTATSEAACARTFIEGFGREAYRRPLEALEVDELVALQTELRSSTSFEDSLGGIIEAVLQGPDFLYRPEFGVPDATNPALLRPSGYEMATRLAYLFWGRPPDAALYQAAESGELLSDSGVLTQASRLLADPAARPIIRFFFDYYLPLNTLTDLARDTAAFPTFSATIGALMRQETLNFLEYEIFEGPGTWPAALTAPYTFVNEPLANFYGIPGVVGDSFQRVDLDTSKRLGLLTQGAIQTGTTISNHTNPVRRGVFLLRHIMCVNLPDPPESIAESVMPPDPGLAATGRERYSAHSEAPTCARCHSVMDPPGFALENFDAVGLWRDQENGVTIDASGQLDLLAAPFNGPVELAQQIAQSEATQNCFAENWMSFGYGRSLDAGDACSRQSVEEAFAQSGFNIQQLLLALTQSDAFLYLSPEQT